MAQSNQSVLYDINLKYTCIIHNSIHNEQLLVCKIFLGLFDFRLSCQYQQSRIIADIISGNCQPLNDPSLNRCFQTWIEISFITNTYINFLNKINRPYYLWEFNHILPTISFYIQTDSGNQLNFWSNPGYHQIEMYSYDFLSRRLISQPLG